MISGLILNFGTQVFAADFGGDCCADLEDRVALLEELSARKGSSRTSLQIYGSVNRGLLYWDNGQDKDVYSVNNDSIESRIGFQGNANIDSEWSVGYRIELGIHVSDSDRVDAGHRIVGKNNAHGDDGDDRMFDLRRNEMFIKSKSLGKLTWGRTNHSLDDTSKVDLGGTNIVGRNDGNRFIEDFVIINSNGAVNQNTDWSDIIPGNLEYARDDVIRYEAPTIAGFRVSATWGEDDEYSFAAFYAGEFGGVKVAAGFGYGIDDDGDRQETINGSISLLHMQTGLFFTGSYGNREHDNSGAEEDVYQIKGGLRQTWNSFGKTIVYGEYIGTKVDNHGDGEILGLGVIQKIDTAGMELYAAYRHYEADLDSQVSTEDFQTLITGARINF